MSSVTCHRASRTVYSLRRLCVCRYAIETTRAPQGLRRHPRARRRRPAGPPRHRLLAARPQRRGQDHHRAAPLHAAAARRRHGPRRRARRRRRPPPRPARDQPHRAVRRGRRAADRRGEPAHDGPPRRASAAPRPAPAPASCSRASTSPTPAAGASAPTRAACAGGSTSRPASSGARRSCSSTSRPSGSTRAAARRCGTSIAELAGEGVTVFLTTQYLEEADRLADRVAVLDGGRIVAEGTPAELKRRVADQRARARARRRRRVRRGRARARRARARGRPGRLVHRRRHRRQRRARARAARRGRPDGRAVRASRCTARRSTTSSSRSRGTAPMPDVALTMAGRCVRLSMRQIDALLTSLLLPVLLMLMFVYLFGGAIETGTRLRHLRRPRRDPAVRRLRLGHHRGHRQPGHDRRDRRPPALDGRRRARGARRPRRGERRAQRGLDRARARRRAADRLPARRRAARLARGRPACCSPFVLAISSLAAALGLLARLTGGRQRHHVRRDVPALRELARSSPSTRCRRGSRASPTHQPITPVIETLRGLLLGTPTARRGPRWRGAPRSWPSRWPRRARCSGAGRPSASSPPRGPRRSPRSASRARRRTPPARSRRG